MLWTPDIEITCEDCMDLMARYPDKHFDLAVVDPPYGIERFNSIKKGDRVHKASDLQKDWNRNKPTKDYWDELFRVSKNQIVWGANNFNLPNSEYFIVWDKKNYYPNFARCEMAFVSMGLKKPAKIFEYAIANLSGKKTHPAQKPVKLYEWIFKNYAEQGQTILDTHLGSGSIAIAAHNYGMKLTGCELDREYYDAAHKRFKAVTSQAKLF